MAWLLVIAAALTEVGMAAALKASEGWTKTGPSVLGVVLALASIFLLTKALPSLPTGPAYAAWTGLGAIGVVLVGVVFHGDVLSLAKVGCIGLIVGGVVGLRVL
jgi:quaternary ammonium compound-resistance protein SugE